LAIVFPTRGGGVNNSHVKEMEEKPGEGKVQSSWERAEEFVGLGFILLSLEGKNSLLEAE